MMKYFKVCTDGRILGVGMTTDDTARNTITQAEYASLSALLADGPGEGYALMEETLTWEPFTYPDGDLEDSEALAIIVGGETL